MLEFLFDYIFAIVVGQVSQQSYGIIMGTNRAPLLADLFMYWYEAELIQKLFHEMKNLLLWTSIVNDVLSINNNQFHSYFDSIYSNELEIRLGIHICFVFRYLIEIGY
jgi:hypothetical protein